MPEATKEQKSINEKYLLPDALMANVHSADPDSKKPVIAFNLVFQFLFHELRNSSRVRKWFYRKLTVELDELITKTTTGKFFDKLTIRDLDLGSQFPEIKNIRVHNVDLHDTEGHIEGLDLLLDLNYNGNFKISFDADMVLGKKGYLSVKVKSMSGLARLQFTRQPYTHWSLCFLGDPKVNLDIETQFQGRQMQSNVTSLISNQIRKAIRRKHVLPNYKLRYKPFFHFGFEDELDTSDIIIDGNVEVNISELSRLIIPPTINSVYCTLTLASIPWVLARQHDDHNVIVSLDLKIHKAKNQQIGIMFKQTEHNVQVEAIIPNTPATKAKFCKGDVLVSIEGKKVSHINHIAKIVKSLNRNVFTLRIERLVAGVIRNDAVSEDFEVYEDFNDFNISFSKTNDSVQIGTKMLRKNSFDKTASSDSSRSNTPTNSPRKQDERNFLKKAKSLSRGNSETKAASDDNSSCKSSASTKGREENDGIEFFQQHSTIDCDKNGFIRMNDLAQFKLNDNTTFFNLNVFGRSNEETVLLGYLNIPILNLLAECNDSNLGYFVKQYFLIPPDAHNLSNHSLSSQSGFDQNLCFGDVLLSFTWSGNNQSSESAKKIKSPRSSTDKLDEDKNDGTTTSKQHDFIRTHFQRSTQCDFCGKKIWLKDAVQCQNCSMCCHKKCINKCQNSTICGPVEATTNMQPQVEFKVTDTDVNDDELEESDEPRPILEQHRQSFSEMISQGIKRVNSANNLAIPGIVAAMNQGSKSLPPSPQHTPRKQSLVNQSTNPFGVVAQKLELLPDDMADITREHINGVTEPLIGFGGPDELMGLAKSSSRTLYADLEPTDRLAKINSLLSKLRIALDSETTSHANLTSSLHDLNKIPEKTQHVETVRAPADSHLLLQTKGPSVESTKRTPKEIQDSAKKAFLIGQSEERVQALSVIMLYLCTGLQYAQGVASQ
ncbi:hypothetical protein HA402_003674 [Bradysia odoriphaga]|nr:hypothetical protein HA402_003674 [Bradysia odoriphaga]